MLNIPERVAGITHPLVKDIYLKRHCSNDGNFFEDVLIIEAGSHDDDLVLEDLLTDLVELQHQAEARIGAFDRIDIRLH